MRLHTDTLEDQFGPLTVQVLRHSDSMRVIFQRSSDGVARAHCVTLFSREQSDWPRRLHGLLAEIKTGQSAGKVFRDAGYAVKREYVYVCQRPAPYLLQQEFACQAEPAMFYAYRLMLGQWEEPPICYGLVLEIYSPHAIPPAIACPVRRDEDTIRAFVLANLYLQD